MENNLSAIVFKYRAKRWPRNSYNHIVMIWTFILTSCAKRWKFMPYPCQCHISYFNAIKHATPNSSFYWEMLWEIYLTTPHNHYCNIKNSFRMNNINILSLKRPSTIPLFISEYAFRRCKLLLSTWFGRMKKTLARKSLFPPEFTFLLHVVL